ncbi:MAG: EAL domain-containing protein [Burkholderiaceae bacterium]
MNQKPLAAPTEIDSYTHLRNLLTQSDGRTWGQFGNYRLSSHFQPIVSLSHCRIIGHEGLMRAIDSTGANISPLDVLAQAAQGTSLHELDRLCSLLHVCNAKYQAGESGWLFLNMHPDVFVHERDDDLLSFANLLQAERGLPTNRVVIEVLEQWVNNTSDGFSEAVARFRERGFLIALDDFGAGHSNFDRVWQLKPEIVKLDRCFAAQIETDPYARRLLPRIVTLLHEAGALVLLEGIETELQAMIALESDIDFAQGYYFARPSPSLVPPPHTQPLVLSLWDNYEERAKKDFSENRKMMAPYENAIGYASVMLAAGKSIEEACAGFLELPRAEFCFLLDHEARQIGQNLLAPGLQNQKPRFLPLVKVDEARWSRRPYFRRANEHFGRICRTRPYLSVATARLCITLSVKFLIGDKNFVLCGDINCD